MCPLGDLGVLAVVPRLVFIHTRAALRANFLGFTHYCGTDQKGKFTVMRQRMLTKLKAVNLELQWRRHQQPRHSGLSNFGDSALGLSRRSLKGYLTWERMRGT